MRPEPIGWLFFFILLCAVIGIHDWRKRRARK